MNGKTSMNGRFQIRVNDALAMSQSSKIWKKVAIIFRLIFKNNLFQNIKMKPTGKTETKLIVYPSWLGFVTCVRVHICTSLGIVFYEDEKPVILYSPNW